MWEAQNKNNQAQMTFGPMYPLLLSEHKLEIVKLNIMGLITLSFMCT